MFRKCQKYWKSILYPLNNMASFSYLWNHRARFTIGSKNFYRAWGKRFFSFQELLYLNWRRNVLVWSGAKIEDTAEIGKVSIIGHKNLLSVGSSSFIGQAYIALHDCVKIGERVCINDDVKILTGSHNVSSSKWDQTKKEIIIDDYVWIGTGAMILPGVHLGRGAVVGAGAVVSKSVEPGGIVVGNPAKVIDKKRCDGLDYNPCEFLSSNRAWLLG